MNTTKSTVLYSDIVTKAWMRNVCDVVIANGGRVAVRTYYTDNWFMEFDIFWPDNLDPEKTLGSLEEATPPQE